MEVCSLIDEHLKLVVETRILELISSPVQKILKFPPYYTKAQRNYIHKLAKCKGLYSTTHEKNGVKYVTVFKEFDNFVKLAPSFRLTDLTQKIIFHYLKHNRMIYDNYKTNMFKSLNTRCLEEIKPKISVYRFCAGTIKDVALLAPPKGQNKLAEEVRRKMPINQYKYDIIEAIKRSQVTILCSDSLHGRISEIPQYLLEEHHANNKSCRIICTLAHKTAAVFTSEVVSAQRGERLGLTVGFQIHLESMSSMSTNLLYTTSNFFLRCLMGTNKQETFSAITHVIVDDINESEPFSRILLHEIRQALPNQPHLKVILMCGQKEVAQLLSYFKEAILFKMKFSLPDKTIYHLDEVKYLINRKILSDSEMHSVNCSANSELIDKVLGRCMERGSEEDFELFIKLMKECELDINIKHSRTKTTLAMAAARHDQINYLMMFANLGGDLSCMDVFNKTVLDWALNSQSELCVEFLHDKIFSTTLGNKLDLAFDQAKSNEIILPDKTWNENDRMLVFNVIYYIHFNLKPGTILVLLPTFSDIIKQDFFMKQKVSQGHISNDIKVYLLHTNTQLADYRLLTQTNDPSVRKVILSTELPMSLLAMEDIIFIVDSGLKCDSINCSLQTAERPPKWISQNCAVKRTFLATAHSKTFCFRLYSHQQFNSLQPRFDAEPETTILKNMCLYAKLLSPETSIGEYMTSLEQKIRKQVVEEAIRELEEIGAVDEAETITSLGIRLVDIPIDSNLAKVLLFGIVLQCLDPVLTIVSILSHQDPLVFLTKVIGNKKPEVADEILSEKVSDHIILLRLYQKWIERADPNEILLTESNFVLNAKLEIISSIRSQLIGILRAGGLIQSSGTMNIHFLNQQANNWSMVKAAFVAGMYPKICRIDRINKELRLKKTFSATIHEKSVLNFNEIHTYQTDWVLYHTLKPTDKQPLITCNTLITPTSLSLFAGSSNLNTDDIVHLSEIESDSESEDFDAFVKGKSVRYAIDEWLSFILCDEDAYLLMGIRQKLYNLFNDVMRVPEDSDKFRKTKPILNDKFGIIGPIGNLLLEEEQANKLPQPKRIGDRPNAFSSKLSKFQDEIATLKNNMMDLRYRGTPSIRHAGSDLTSKAFFVKKVPSRDDARRYFEKVRVNSNLPTWNEIIMRYHNFPTVNIIVFLLLDESDVFCGTGQLYFEDNFYYLNEIASREVSVNELKAIYFTNGEYFPGTYDGQELGFDVAKRFFDLFLAFRETILFIFASCFIAQPIQCARILVVTVFPGKSHIQLTSTIVKELSYRGHEVTFVTNYHIEEPLLNYTEILIEPIHDFWQDVKHLFKTDDLFSLTEMSTGDFNQLVHLIGLTTTEHALKNPKIQKLMYDTKLEFDLLLAEQFYQEAFLALAYKYNVPVVTMTTLGFGNYMSQMMGFITPWAFVPHGFVAYSDRMNLYERFINVYYSLYEDYDREVNYFPKQDILVKKYFSHLKGPLPSVSKMEKNISLILLNSHIPLTTPRPSVMGMVQVGGLHIKKPKPLPADIKEFLDGATEGAIYFSLGTNLQSSDMPAEKRSILLKVFASMKQRVLWKWEDDKVPNLSNNTMIKKWMPQSDILAHTNVKVFITHGGLFGTQEAVYWGVPMLGMPIYCDQHLNMNKASKAGYAISLYFPNITEESLRLALSELLYNPVYRNNIQKVSTIFRDRPMPALETAMYWIEYVIRYKGAPQIRSAGMDLPWYSYYLIDIVCIILGAFFVIFALAFYVLRRIIKSTRKSIKEKRN